MDMAQFWILDFRLSEDSAIDEQTPLFFRRVLPIQKQQAAPQTEI
jgi:hypothetical protein